MSSNIGELELNSLIFQDDIAKMNRTLEDARKGARDVGRMLESKQLWANTSKSKFVVIGTPESRTEILKEAEANPIKMADTIIENSKSESTPNPEGHGEALPATDRETCPRGREGLLTHAVVAISARDMSVGELISDHPPYQNVHQRLLKWNLTKKIELGLGLGGVWRGWLGVEWR